MISRKPWYRSKTIIGALVAGASAVASMTGIDLDAEAQKTVVSTILEGSTIGGSILALFGRLKADTEIR